MNTVNHDNIFIGGDFNTDFSRTASCYTNQLLNFCSDECLIPSPSIPNVNVDFTFESKINGARSWIDHFLPTEVMNNYNSWMKVQHDVDNLSDHSPVMMNLIIAVSEPILPVIGVPSNGSNRVDWQRADQNKLGRYKNGPGQAQGQVLTSSSDLTRLPDRHKVTLCPANGARLACNE